MSECHPCIYIVSPGGTDEYDYPDPGAVRENLIAALDAEGWSAHDTLLNVREDVIDYQDEYPPAPPVELPGVVIVLGQLPVTNNWGYPGPFRVVLDALEELYPDKEFAIDAVES